MMIEIKDDDVAKLIARLELTDLEGVGNKQTMKPTNDDNSAAATLANATAAADDREPDRRGCRRVARRLRQRAADAL